MTSGEGAPDRLTVGRVACTAASVVVSLVGDGRWPTLPATVYGGAIGLGIGVGWRWLRGRGA